MKSRWMQTLAWIAAAVTALLMALVHPEAVRSGAPGPVTWPEMPQGAAAPR